ncbi:MAG: glycoside hydrolase family 2 TIM barrel-domain containing protein [Lachnospiraceae bacterium]
MRLLDAVSTLKPKKHEKTTVSRMTTIWSEQIDPGSVLPEYPRPQFRRENWICLNGPWDYTFTKKNKRPERPDGQILVPFSPECIRSGVSRQLLPGEYLWYFRFVYLNTIPENQRLLLHFGAVDHSCSVWWNGHLLGKHENGYLSFSFDVTDYLQEGNNTLWVRVQDDSDSGSQSRGKQSLKPHGMFYTAQSGIWQTVWMEWVPEKRIEKLKITPLYDEGSVRLEITLTQPQDMEIRMLWNRDSYCHYVEKEDFPADQNTFVRDIRLPDFRPWSPEDPFLYEVQLITETDTVHSYFAMRKFSLGLDEKQQPKLFLNNQPYFFNGVLDQGYWPESLYTAPSDEALVFDIRSMKELGFNMIRKHVKVEPMRWYYHCDRLGMVVWQDMVNGGGKPLLPLVCYLPNLFPPVTTRVRDNLYWFFSRTSKKARRKWEEEAMELIDQLYNVPCIGLWVLFNEGWGQFDSLRLTEKIHLADPGRLVDHASGWFDQGGGDVKSAHNYFRPLRVRTEQRPFILSEYGGHSCPVDGHLYSSNSFGYHTYKDTMEFTAAWQSLQKKIRELQGKGLAGAVYTQLSDVEEETNGLYTYDRKVCKVERK